MFISIVVGIGIDYGIYFLFRYDEERGLGATVPERSSAPPCARARHRAGRAHRGGRVPGALADLFQGIREFGLVSGIAILMAFLAMLTLFPATLVLIDRRPVTAGRGRDEPGAAVTAGPLARADRRATARASS